MSYCAQMREFPVGASERLVAGTGVKRWLCQFAIRALTVLRGSYTINDNIDDGLICVAADQEIFAPTGMCAQQPGYISCRNSIVPALNSAWLCKQDRNDCRNFFVPTKTITNEVLGRRSRINSGNAIELRKDRPAAGRCRGR